MVPTDSERRPSPTGPPTAPAMGPGARATTWAVAGSLLAWAALAGRDLWFFSDDWNILTEYPRGNLLEPFNGHLSLLPAGLYQALFNTVGVGSYVPYRIVGLVGLGVLAFQVGRYAGARAAGWVAPLAVGAVLWNSYGSTNVMFPFLVNFSLPIAALVAVWWHLDRDTTRNDVAAGVWLAVALASSGLGVMVLGAVVVELALRRAPLRQWVAFAPATLLWLLWWVQNRGANELSTDPGEVVPYALRMLWGGTTSLAAEWAPGGLVLGAGLVVVAVVAATRWRTLDARAAGALAAPLAFVGLTSLTRVDVAPAIPPDELRYGWTVAAYLVLFVVVVLPRDLPRRLPASAPAIASVAAITVVLAAGGVRLAAGIDDWVDQVAGAAPGLRSSLYAAEAAGAGRVETGFVMPLSFVPVTAGEYVRAVDLVGSPLAGAPAGSIGGRPDQREAADDLLFASVSPFVLAGGTPPADPADCTTAVDVAPGALVTVVAPEGVAAPAVEVSRFAARPAVVLRADGGGVHRLQVPADAPLPTSAEVPYRLVGLDGVVLCGASP